MGAQATRCGGKSFLKAFLCLVVMVTLVSLGVAIASPAETNPSRTVAGSTQFALDLYGRLRAQPGNLFLSPFGISTCLAMVEAGASGDTAAQMKQVLHFPPGTGEMAQAYRDISDQLGLDRLPGSVDFDLANTLWGQTGHPFLQEFVNLAQSNFNANLNQADFRTGAEAARKQINSWVSGHTGGRVNDLLVPGVLDASTRLVLVNAIYFKGKWQEPFEQRDTFQGPFTGVAGEAAAAWFMHATNRCGYAENGTMQLLELPYAGNYLSMVVILPKQSRGLPAIEAQLNITNFDEWLGQLDRPSARMLKVNVFLPKFKITSEFSLGATLSILGMSDAFSPTADFSGMDGARDLVLSAVVHKAFVDVDEAGTEATAATGAGVRALAIMRPPVIPLFRARPSVSLPHSRHQIRRHPLLRPHFDPAKLTARECRVGRAAVDGLPVYPWLNCCPSDNMGGA